MAILMPLSYDRLWNRWLIWLALCEAYVHTIEQLPRLRSINLSRVSMGAHKRGLSRYSAWQLIDRTLKVVPQLVHFSTPCFVSYDRSGKFHPIMRRLAGMERLRSLELLIELRWDDLETVILPRLAQKGKLEVSRRVEGPVLRTANSPFSTCSCTERTGSIGRALHW